MTVKKVFTVVGPDGKLRKVAKTDHGVEGLRAIAQVIPCQGCYFQRFEILKAHGVKGRRPLGNQGILSISSAKMNQKLSWIKVENEVQFA